ncbi:hypothetical protein BJX63DRAFT_430156 [Aspergillus granulosus]|uniref:Uncharacterized protein n=1 Tax=Aspergillus granulosus TaxID=176169 RepID=A0ABR4HLV0_9EURO
MDDFDPSSVADRVAALKGAAVPSSLISPISVCCVVKGIRYHDGFAQELYGNPELQIFTRALNARAIIRNSIPETLRQLLAQYPDNTLLRYQVGRACAVAGYSSLCHELYLLLDVAITEEARDSDVGQDIYEAIMNAPVRYAYVDDYNCCYDHSHLPAHILMETLVSVQRLERNSLLAHL